MNSTLCEFRAGSSTLPEVGVLLQAGDKIGEAKMLTSIGESTSAKEGKAKARPTEHQSSVRRAHGPRLRV